MAIEAKDVIDFWFEPEHEARWFDATTEFDARCAERFGQAIELAGSGSLDHWQDNPEGVLALILLLDQMTRNVYRGSAQAFVYDIKALGIAKAAVGLGLDQQVPWPRRFFIYLPYEHSEDRDDQARAVELFEAYGDPLKLDYAIRHQVIVDRFGRFPHRNACLNRPSTPEEIEFLKQPGSSF